MTAAPPPSRWARTWEELAEAIGMTEPGLYQFRQRHLDRIRADGRKLTRGDGRHEIEAWKQLRAELGTTPIHSVTSTMDERQLRLKERQMLLAKAEHKLAVERREVLPLTEYQDALRITVGAFDAALQQFAGRSTERVITAVRLAMLAMLKGELTGKQFEKVEKVLLQTPIDHASVAAVFEDEVEAVRRSLAQADFLQVNQPEEGA